MDRLDGNAIAGSLVDVFGRDMTTAIGTCGQCGRVSPFAELAVYLLSPGVVARCPQCDHLLIVIVNRRGTACVDLSGFAALEEPPMAVQ